MLHTIPFHGSLLNQLLPNGKKTTNAHVLIYGAIEVHASGNKGCIASNETIAKETGYSKQTIKDRLVEMSKIGWVTVVMKEHRRVQIIPNASIVFIQKKGVLSAIPGGIVEDTIDNSIENKVAKATRSSVEKKKQLKNQQKKTSDEFLFDETTKPTASSPPDPAAPPKAKAESDTTFALLCRVRKKYHLTVNNFDHVKTHAKRLEVEQGIDRAQLMLQRLLERDLVKERESDEFVPMLSTTYKLVNDAPRIIDYLKRTRGMVTPTTDKRDKERDRYLKELEELNNEETK